VIRSIGSAQLETLPDRTSAVATNGLCIICPNCVGVKIVQTRLA